MVIKTSIPEATGATIKPEMLEKQTFFYITDFGASTDAAPTTNTTAINETIKKASSIMGATVVIPKGTFQTYTICLRSNVNIFFEDGACIAAALPDAVKGGNYNEPEVNKYLGIQDHGHSYFANSLVYGVDLENIMIYGNGLFTGGHFSKTTGLLEYILTGADPFEPYNRAQNGHRGEWFGNKCISLVRCKNIVLTDFSVTIGGHFAIIAEGCKNMYVNNVLIDTTRDAFDIDCCQDVTVTNTICNSLTDDAICLKASYGAGTFMPTQNVLIEDCTVSGYDAGSVYAGEYTRDKLIAEDRCGPTGRVKLGTESTCGYHQVTIRRVKFDRSRGFALEAVDCSSLTDIIFTDCTMDNVSSSPIFIRLGDRGRYPVTGISNSEEYPAIADDVRTDNCNWILPNKEGYTRYPARRYAPHYNRTRRVTIDGHSYIDIIDDKNPTHINPTNFDEVDGKYYLKTWDEATATYQTDLTHEIPKRDLALYANAIGSKDMAKVENIYIGNVKITNADPRYPILIMGLTDSHVKNVTLENIDIEYRGGLNMTHAVEQRQLNTQWKYSQFHAEERVQTLPWLVNTFFAKHEALLPRVEWDKNTHTWKDAPFNIPELPEVYPEPSNWGILPSYGIFARHVDGLFLKNVNITCKVPDKRHVCVFDDGDNITLENVSASYYGSGLPIILIKNHFRRHTNCENVPEQEYFTTRVTNFTNDTMLDVEEIEVNAPAPGTPSDSLYGYPSVPSKGSGYSYKTATDEYPLVQTVHRPYIIPMKPFEIKADKTLSFTLKARVPASDISDINDDGKIYNEMVIKNYYVSGADTHVKVYSSNLPEGATFDEEKLTFTWHPTKEQLGEHNITFIINDGILPEKITVKICVK
jgi:polygalacturonase